MKPADLYHTMMAAGFVPYIAQPRLLVNAIRVSLGLPQYRAVGGWLPRKRRGHP